MARRVFGGFWALGGAALLAGAGSGGVGVTARGEEPRLAAHYGFRPLEIYKLDDRIGGLVVRDLDGDRTDDIAVVNNGRSRIDLLLSRGGKPAPEGAASGPNAIPSDRRMRPLAVPVNHEVVSLQVGDLTGDGRPDLVYYGTPAHLVVLPNPADGAPGEPRRLPVGEGVGTAGALALGDLSGDGKDDAVLLTPQDLVIFVQGEAGALADPVRLPHSASNPLLVRVVDLDGDGAKDLLVLDDSPDDPLRVRFGAKDGRLGPEDRLALETPRALTLADVDGKPGVEVLTVEGRSGRARVLRLAGAGEAGATAGESRARIRTYALPRGGTRDRSVALGDVDGDGKPDVVAVDPAGARLFVYLHGPDGPRAPREFPTLGGVTSCRVADLDGDGKGEILLLSDSEKVLALTRFADDRVAFPTPLPTAGVPLATEAVDLDGDGAPEVLYVVAAGAEEGRPVFGLRALKRDAKAGAFVAFRWGDAEGVPLRGLNGPPTGLRALDANGDAHPDLIVFNPFGDPQVLVGAADKPPAPPSAGVGPLSGSDAAKLGPPPKGHAGVLVARGGFAREVALDAEGRWTVKDQFNAGADAQVGAAAALDADGDGTPEIALWDRGARALRLLDRAADGTYRPGAALPLGTLDVREIRTADLDGNGRDDLLLVGPDRFAVVLTGRARPRLVPIAEYEVGPTREDAYLGDLAAADLNGDGGMDLVLADTGEHYLEILALRLDPGKTAGTLLPALAFRIYERKSLRDPGRRVEPRDLATGDVDGDGRQDLVLIVHDRVLVYRQDPGAEKVAAPAPAANPGAKPDAPGGM
jgi:hypothetical protein